MAFLHNICVSACLLLAISAAVLPVQELQAFASRPAASIVRSTELGRIESPHAKATFTVVVVKDTATGEIMRGLRIVLEHAGTMLPPPARCDWKVAEWNVLCGRANAAVYIGEERLGNLAADLAAGRPLRPSEYFIPYWTNWDSPPPPGGVSGFILWGYSFEGLQRDELAAELKKAAEFFATMPR